MSSLRVENRHHDDTFSSSPLVAWIRSYVGATSLTLDELSSGLLLHDVLTHIDPHAFTHLHIQYGVHDVTSRAHNLVEIFNGMKHFYLEKLHQLVVAKVPDVLMLVRDPNNEQIFSEIKNLLLLILGCAIQCDRKQEFIEHIKQLDVDVQRGLVLSIQEITENPDIVIPYRLGELCEMNRDELMLVCENLYGHVQNVMEQRDDYIGTLMDYVQHNDNLPNTDKRRNSSTNQRRGSQNVLIYGNNMQTEKDRITTLQSELDDQNIVMVEMKKQFDQLKVQLEAIRVENKQLKTEAALTKRYRDELDTAKEQMEENMKTKDENDKLKQVLEEMECYKNKCEKDEEKISLLLKQKLSLEEQVRDQVCKIHKLEVVDTENEKLCAQVTALLEEQNEDQKQIRDLVDQVVKITGEKQESVNMCATLANQLKGLRSNSSADTNVMTELNHSMNEENQYMQSIFTNPDNEDLGDLQTPRVPEQQNNKEHYKYVIRSLIDCLRRTSDNLYCSSTDMDIDIGSIQNTRVQFGANMDIKISKLATMIAALIHKWITGSINAEIMRRLDEILNLPLNDNEPDETTSNMWWEDAENVINEKNERIIELEMRLTSISDLSNENERMNNELTAKEEAIRRLEERVDQLNEQTRNKEEKEAKVVGEVTRLSAENFRLKQQREKAIEQLGNHLENSKKLMDKHSHDVSFDNDDLQIKCYCVNKKRTSGRKKPSKDKTMDFLKESLDNLNNWNRKTSGLETICSSDDSRWAIEDNLDRVKELKYINEQLKDIMKIKEQKVTKIKEGLVRVTYQNNDNTNNQHDSVEQIGHYSKINPPNLLTMCSVETDNENADYHIKETISNINELTELNNVLKGTLVVEDRTIHHLSESVVNLDQCTDRGRVEMYDDDSLEDITPEDDVDYRTERRLKLKGIIDEPLHNAMNLTNGRQPEFHLNDYI